MRVGNGVISQSDVGLLAIVLDVCFCRDRFDGAGFGASVSAPGSEKFLSLFDPFIPIEVSGDGKYRTFGSRISVVEFKAIAMCDRFDALLGSESGSAEGFAVAKMFKFFEAFLGGVIFDRSEFEEGRLSDFFEFIFGEVRFSEDSYRDFEGRVQDAGHAGHRDVCVEGRHGA